MLYDKKMASLKDKIIEEAKNEEVVVPRVKKVKKDKEKKYGEVKKDNKKGKRKK